MKNFVLAGFTVFLFCGCATVELAPDNLDALSKRFEVPKNKSSIYLFMPNRASGFGAAVSFDVLLDGYPKGKIVNGRYHWFVVDSGKHALGVRSPENLDLLYIDAEPNKAYFAEAKFTMGWAHARVDIVEADHQRGREVVASSKLAKSLGDSNIQ